MSKSQQQIAVIGGGPAGLRAAEVAAAGGARVTVFEAKASVGRKFLVAGRGGLNLTNEEPLGVFARRYAGRDQPSGIWESLLDEFGPAALRQWAADLGSETFAASSGRVYPRALKAAPLLRAWVRRLRSLGVEFAVHHRWTGVEKEDKCIRLRLQSETGERHFVVDAAILALGGGSWPETGSDGAWAAALREAAVVVAPLTPANCGWEVAWSDEVLTLAEGKPLKNIAARAGTVVVAGELLVTRYGLEGGVIYELGPALRGMDEPALSIDLKPPFSVAELVAKLGPVRRNFLAEARQRWRLSDAAFAVLSEYAKGRELPSGESLGRMCKDCVVSLLKPRPLAEAISSAGGVRWNELDSSLMLKRLPGIFVAGEMIDWEAPTGGFLLQGCFASGTRAAKGALEWTRPFCAGD